MQHSHISKSSFKKRRGVSKEQDKMHVAKVTGRAGQVMRLQRLIGNQGVVSMLHTASGSADSASPGVLQRRLGDISFGPIEDDSELVGGAQEQGSQDMGYQPQSGQEGARTSTPMPPVLSPVERLPRPPVESSDDYDVMVTGDRLFKEAEEK
jgi:hypothetical protein